MSNGLWLVILFMATCCYAVGLIIYDKEFKDD
jgi:hypothetical protein